MKWFAFRRALALEEAGRFREARDAFAEVGSAEAWARAGACSTRLGELALAVRQFRTARDAEPGLADHWLNYANACRRVGDSVEAGAAFDEALKRAPDRPDILYYRAEADGDRMTLSAMQGARRAFRVLCGRLERPAGAAEIEATGFPVERPLIFLRNLALEKQLLDEGAAALTEFVDRKPGTSDAAWVAPAALNHRGLLFAAAGRFDEARRDYEASLAARPSDDVRYNLAMLHVRRHAWDAARREFAAFARRHPRSPVATFGPAVMAETRGDLPEAVRLYRVFLDRHAAAPPSPAELATLDVPANWTARARTFLDATGRPGEGGVHEVSE